jgi:hypothetical protein
MTIEGTPAMIVAVAAALRSTMAFESVAPAVPVVVPRLVAIEHDTS